MKRLIVIIGILVVVIAGFLYWSEKNELLELTLTSPHNTAMYNQVEVKLAKEAPVYIEYWEKATGRKFRTCVSSSKLDHKLDLLLLKAGTEYEYQIVIDNLFHQKSKVLSFKTREIGRASCRERV